VSALEGCSETSTAPGLGEPLPGEIGLPVTRESTPERLCATCESPGTTARLLGAAWKCLATGLPSERCIAARPLAERFWEKVRFKKASQCWLWTANRDRNGYGRFSVGSRKIPGSRRNVSAHRFAYELLCGPIPPGLDLDHFRMNPGPRNAPCSTACVNPDHPEAVTPGEHAMRGDTLASRNAAKTHCPHGHSLDDAYVYPYGRRCRTCTQVSNAARVWKAERALRRAA